MQTLDDQVAVVTGAGHGSGRGIASVLAGEGARVVMADVDAAASGRTAAAMVREGKEALAVPCDVTQRASVEELAAAVLSAWGRIDILAANAGIYPTAELAAIDDALWYRVMDINVKGALHAIQACTPAILDRGYGRIVLTSSITGPNTGQAGYAPYGASKAAMLGLMRRERGHAGEHRDAGAACDERREPARSALVHPAGPLRDDGGRRLGRCASWPPLKPAMSPARR
jgi:3-oxoacyl-[acyl-carrier protein] reductase